MTEQECRQVLGNLVIGEAIALPVTEEAAGDVRRIRGSCRWQHSMGTCAAGTFQAEIANVFGDYPLANTVRRVEDDYRAGGIPDVTTGLLQAIRSRYEFIEPEAGSSV